MIQNETEKDSDLENILTVAGGEGRARGLLVWDGHGHLLYLRWIINKDLLYSTGNSAQYYVAAWRGGEFAEELIPISVWLSSFAIHLKLSQHF